MKPVSLWQVVCQTLKSLSSTSSHRQGCSCERVEYSVWHVLKVYLCCMVQRIAPWLLYEKLEREGKFYRRQWVLPNKLISLSQLKKRLNTACFARALVQYLSYSAQRVLKKLGEQEVSITLMDLTRIESIEGRDPYGATGADSRGFFYGYKLGLITSQQGVILGMTLMRANRVEGNVNCKLIRMAREVIETAFGKVEVDFLLCDSGFDGESTHRTGYEQLGGARVLCPPRRKRNPKAKNARYIQWRAKKYTPYRYANGRLLQQDLARQVYQKRNRVEQVNGQLKGPSIGIAEVPCHQRGVKRLRRICLAKLIIYNLCLYANVQNGHRLRAIRHLVG